MEWIGAAGRVVAVVFCFDIPVVRSSLSLSLVAFRRPCRISASLAQRHPTVRPSVGPSVRAGVRASSRGRDPREQSAENEARSPCKELSVSQSENVPNYPGQPLSATWVHSRRVLSIYLCPTGSSRIFDSRSLLSALELRVGRGCELSGRHPYVTQHSETEDFPKLQSFQRGS